MKEIHPNFRRIRSVHLIGVGGSGMSGIAEVLHNLGYVVTGSDIAKNAVTERLASLGIRVAYSHIAENVADCDVVVVSSAIKTGNVELETARLRRIPIVPRATMLAELMRFKHGIAVAGTHGKTTTTSLIATVFAAAGLDPTFVVGGQINSFGYNARLGQGRDFIVEADESDASFLDLSPMVSVVTNIDRDHMENYGDDFARLSQAFLDFIHRVPFYGMAVLCIDDPVVRSLLPKITRPFLTYGFAPDADIRALDWQVDGCRTNFVVSLPGVTEPQQLQVNLAGKHNVLNALAAIAVGLDANISLMVIADALRQFKGVGRRFQVLVDQSLGNGKRVVLLDDYGHHPREVQAVIDAVHGSWPGQRVVMVYQPHRYSRTKALFEDIVATLSNADRLLMLEIYSAGEAEIPGIDSRALCGSIRMRGLVDPIFVAHHSELLTTLNDVLADGDIVVMQGAGDISKLAKQIATEFVEA